jgi:hypothetical protein
VLALTDSFDFDFWFHLSPLVSSKMPRISENRQRGL